MSRYVILAALCLTAVANASLFPHLDLSNIPEQQVGDAPINGLCVNFTTRFHAKPEWAQLAGVWNMVAISMATDNATQTNQTQQGINDNIGCYKERFVALDQPYNINATVDTVFRKPVDNSMLSPGCIVIGNNEVRCPLALQAANSSNPSDGRLVFQVPTQKGTLQGSAYWIATDYNNFALFYSCVALPGSTAGAQVYSYGVLSRQPQELNSVQKFLYKLLAQAAGVAPASTDHLFDFPQDQCF